MIMQVKGHEEEYICTHYTISKNRRSPCTKIYQWSRINIEIYVYDIYEIYIIFYILHI